MVLLSFLYLHGLAQDNTFLFPIREDNLYGYIDKNGKIIVKPQFLNGGQFLEGLAPVRVNGTYGYIDKNGGIVISPQYDLALPFYSGMAKVFIDGRPYFIDKSGKILFQHTYRTINEFRHHTYAAVVTETGKHGVISRTGKLLADTIFSNLRDFSSGMAVVTGLRHNPYSRDPGVAEVHETGLIDTTGKWLVKFGKYKSIDNFFNGVALVEKFNDVEGIIDANGKYLFTIPQEKWSLAHPGNFYESIAIVNIYVSDPETIKAGNSGSRSSINGAINLKGQVLFSNPEYEVITPFHHNRAFAKTSSNSWYLINSNGEKINRIPFEDIMFDSYGDDPTTLFENGKAFVETDKGWGAIDTSGKFVISPIQLDEFDYDRLIRKGDVVIIMEDISIESDDYAYRYGFWDTKNNAIIKPRYHYIDMDGFDKELVYVMQDGQMGYIDHSGKQAWNGGINKAGKLNIDFMNRGHYYASSKYQAALAGYGGWASSNNASKNIAPGNYFSPGSLQVLIDPEKKTRWAGEFDGMKLWVANTLTDTIYFDAQDSRLYLKLQAKDRNGNWKDIEYIPNSWCGNSYHTLFLAPNEYWEFSTPVFQGEYKTRLRAQLYYKMDKSNQADQVVAYSNEIDGFVNPGQFWNKREYLPGGIMDPYRE